MHWFLCQDLSFRDHFIYNISRNEILVSVHLAGRKSWAEYYFPLLSATYPKPRKFCCQYIDRESLRSINIFGMPLQTQPS